MLSRADTVPAKLAIGLLLPTREAEVGGTFEARALVALAVSAERLGYDSVSAGESPLARPRVDALTLLAGVASRRRTVGMGTADRRHERSVRLT